MEELEPAEGDSWASAKFDLLFGWADAPHGGWEIDIESGIGGWPRIEERIQHVVEALLSDGDPSVLLPNETEASLRCDQMQISNDKIRPGTQLTAEEASRSHKLELLFDKSMQRTHLTPASFAIPLLHGALTCQGMQSSS
jgi:hypothetical protein